LPEAPQDGPAGSSEYDTIGAGGATAGDDNLDLVRDRFAVAGSAYLSSPIPWLGWSVILPAAALLTTRAMKLAEAPGVLFLWTVAILVGGAIEGLNMRRRRARGGSLARWVFRVQGNLSLVALALSVALLLRGLPWLLPGVWLLLLGHSLFALGGLSFPPLRTAGLIYQIGGLAALGGGERTLWIFAAATAAANLWVAWSISRASGILSRSGSGTR
jgi:hypothetical protein